MTVDRTIPNFPLKLAKDLAAILVLAADNRTAKRRLNELLALIRGADRPALPLLAKEADHDS